MFCEITKPFLTFFNDIILHIIITPINKVHIKVMVGETESVKNKCRVAVPVRPESSADSSRALNECRVAVNENRLILSQLVELTFAISAHCVHAWDPTTTSHSTSYFLNFIITPFMR